MKILLIIPTLKHGGAERVVSELANSLVDKDHEVTIVLWIGRERFYSLDKKIDVVDFNSLHGSKIDKVMGLFTIVYRLRKLYRLKKPDAVVSFLTKSNILAILSKSFMHTKVYISERNSPDRWDSHSKVILALRDLTYKHATGFIAQTNTAKIATQERFGISRCIVMPNPIKEILLPKGIEKENIILNVGRLEEQKGQKYLLEAYAKLNRPEWKLVILGEGSLRDELEEYAKVLKISENVLMPGSVKNIDEWLGRARVFAFPSLYEGFPNALLEAMGAGLPCVSFDCETGPSDLIRDGKNGFLVPLKDTDLFTGRLQELIDNKNLRDQFSSEAIEVNTIYGLENISTVLLDFINNGEDSERK